MVILGASLKLYSSSMVPIHSNRIEKNRRTSYGFFFNMIHHFNCVMHYPFNKQLHYFGSCMDVVQCAQIIRS